MKHIDEGCVGSSEDSSGSNASTVLAPRSRENSPDKGTEVSDCESRGCSRPPSAKMNGDFGHDVVASSDQKGVPEDPLKTTAGGGYDERSQKPIISVKKSEVLFDVVAADKENSSFKSPKGGSKDSLPQPSQVGCGITHRIPVVAATPPLFRTRLSVKQKEGNQTKMIGSEVVVSPLRRSTPLPPCIQISKRTLPLTPVCSNGKVKKEMSTMKRKLQDAMPLVPKNIRRNVTDALARRGVTMISYRKPNVDQQLKTRPLPKSICPTVDLTRESDTPQRSFNRSRLRGRNTCEICDKAFPSEAELTAHLAVHRGPLRLECPDCSATYSSEAALETHRSRYHAATGGSSPDMAIPVVDLSQGDVRLKLSQLGIRSVIPLSQLYSTSGSGQFAIPVVALDGASNPAICNISGIGASNLLPLGPLLSSSYCRSRQ